MYADLTNSCHRPKVVLRKGRWNGSLANKVWLCMLCRSNVTSFETSLSEALFGRMSLHG
jgi:hypothetical protein